MKPDKSYQIIKTSTVNAFTVDFELRKLISNCDSSITRMTPCLEKAYAKVFGSGYNDLVKLMSNLSRTALEGKVPHDLT